MSACTLPTCRSAPWQTGRSAGAQRSQTALQRPVASAPDRRAARSQAYAWLASKMGLTEAQCHFGQFDEPQCDAAMKIFDSAYADLRRQIQRGGEIPPSGSSRS